MLNKKVIVHMHKRLFANSRLMLKVFDKGIINAIGLNKFLFFELTENSFGKPLERFLS